jgi:hypothetical protein
MTDDRCFGMDKVPSTSHSTNDVFTGFVMLIRHGGEASQQ